MTEEDLVQFEQSFALSFDAPELRNKLFALIDRCKADIADRRPRPIASAPRDGTHVRLFFGSDGVAEGWWENDDTDPRPWKFVDRGCPGSPFKNGETINGARDVRGGPTAWLPLDSDRSNDETRA